MYKITTRIALNILMEPEKRPIILIAEDDESNYLLLFALLKRDYQIIHAHDGIEAIQLFKNFPPDAILMDIKMPHMDGLTAMQNHSRNRS